MSKGGGNVHHKIKKSIKHPSPVGLVISTGTTQLCLCMKETSLWEKIYAFSNKNVIGNNSVQIEEPTPRGIKTADEK